MHNILNQIIEKKREDLKEKNEHDKNMFKNSILKAKDIAIIAEIKLATPTNPSLALNIDSVKRALEYESSQADAISYITEKHFFKGNISDVSQIKSKVKIPLLLKDFIVDPYQIYEAKSAGADAVLLIARLIDSDTIRDFVALCLKIGIEPVVEINSFEDLEKATQTSTSIIAVNARDLDTFNVDIDFACQLIEKISSKYIKLGFSGITSVEEVRKYKSAGADGILVGTSLMQATNIKEFIKSLRSL